MTPQEYLDSIALDGETWTAAPGHEDYWMSSLHRAASTKGMPSHQPCKLIRVFRNKEKNQDYFNVCEAGIRDSVYFPKEEINVKDESLREFYAEQDEKDKLDILELAEELLGSVSHSDFKLVYDALLDARKWGRKVERNPPVNIIW